MKVHDGISYEVIPTSNNAFYRITTDSMIFPSRGRIENAFKYELTSLDTLFRLQESVSKIELGKVVFADDNNFKIFHSVDDEILQCAK